MGFSHRCYQHQQHLRPKSLDCLFEFTQLRSEPPNPTMRLSNTPPTLLSLIFIAFSHIPAITAIPFDLQEFGFAWLQDRGYGNCGADLQYTCTAGQSCSTTVNAAGTPIAFCGAAAASVGGGAYSYAVYTTTYTETDLVLRTSTYTSSWEAAATTSVYVAPAAAICTPSLGQQSCGVICCASTQACAGSGWCTDTATSLWSYTAPAPTVTSTYSAPLRPTSGGVTTATSVVAATTTQPFIAPATASGSTLPVTAHSSSGGLSGGAIAGIVIGVIAGIIILLLICFCCCLKAGFDGLLALFGLGKRRRRSTEKIETVERYSRHGSGTASRRDTHTGWFGRSSGPTRVTEERKKSSSGFGGLGAVGAGLIGLAVLLGLKRRHDRKEKVARSEVHSSYYTDSYTGTSASM